MDQERSAYMTALDAWRWRQEQRFQLREWIREALLVLLPLLAVAGLVVALISWVTPHLQENSGAVVVRDVWLDQETEPIRLRPSF